MNKPLMAGLAIIAIITILPFIVAAMPGSDGVVMLAKLDADDARELKQSGKIMPLEELIARVRKDYPGQIIQIELDEEKDRFIYEIEVLNDEGVVIELELDAATGEVLKYEKEY
jgi:uncharacterized membrane protein YkoI